MRLVIVNALNQEKIIRKRLKKHITLGEIFNKSPSAIVDCFVNGVSIDNWQSYSIQDNDEIVVHVDTKDPGTWTIIIQIAITVLTTVIAALLAPKPKKPSDKKNQPSLGVAGLQNTVAPGTPKFLSYGKRRVFGHVIASKTELAASFTGENMPSDMSQRLNYSIVYYMGTGPIKSITSVKVNETQIEDLEGPPIAQVRLGTADQVIIPGHEHTHQVYSDGRELDVRTNQDINNNIEARSLTYSTKSSQVDKVTFILNMPNGMWSGTDQVAQQFTIAIDAKLTETFVAGTSSPYSTYTRLATVDSIRRLAHKGLFWSIPIELPQRGKWDYKIYIESQLQYQNQNSGVVLFNVQETIFKTTTYPKNALLEISGIANEQITGLENMAASALVEGRLVGVPKVNSSGNYTGFYVPAYTRNRVWIIRDILVNADIGLGNRVSPAIWDDGAAIIAARYYENMLELTDATVEQRDFCDIILTDIRPGWDWIKILLAEGRGILVPSSGKLKYIVDQPRTPNLLYSFPGNIIENTLKMQLGREDKLINVLRSEFPDELADFKVVPLKLDVATKLDTDPERSDNVSFTSITRKSQATREMKYLLAKATLNHRRWEWESPRNALVSEPFDVDLLSYNVSRHLRGYSGFFSQPAPSLSQVVLPVEVFLEGGFTYTLHTRHDYTTNERVISNITGRTHSIINLTSPLSFLPGLGDTFSLGKQNKHVVPIQQEQIEYDGEKYKLTCREYIPEVFAGDLDALDPEVVLKNPTRPFIGYGGKRVSIAGVTHAQISVVPGYDHLAGIVTYLGVGSNEGTHNFGWEDNAFIDNQMAGAYLEVQVATGKNVYNIDTNAYLTGGSSIPDLSGTLISGTNVLTAGSTYSYLISWPSFAPYGGFNVYRKDNGGTGNLVTTPIVVPNDTVTLLATTYATTFYRVEPFNTLGLTGSSFNDFLLSSTALSFPNSLDVSAVPAPPFTGFLDTGTSRIVETTITLSKPLNRDISAVEVYYLKQSAFNSTTGITVAGGTFSILTYKDEEPSDVTFSIKTDLSDVANFGDSIFTRVHTLDVFNNRSTNAYVSFSGVTLSSVVTTLRENEIGHTHDPLTLTGVGSQTFYTSTVPGGLFEQGNAVEVDAQFQVSTSGNVVTTINFTCGFNSATISTITCSVGSAVASIPAGSYYWLNWRLVATDSTTITSALKKNGPEVGGSTLRFGGTGTALNINPSLDIPITLGASTTLGGSTTSVVFKHLVVRSIIQ
jgi:hypothetical protein